MFNVSVRRSHFNNCLFGVQLWFGNHSADFKIHFEQNIDMQTNHSSLIHGCLSPSITDQSSWFISLSVNTASSINGFRLPALHRRAIAALKANHRCNAFCADDFKIFYACMSNN